MPAGAQQFFINNRLVLRTADSDEIRINWAEKFAVKPRKLVDIFSKRTRGATSLIQLIQSGLIGKRVDPVAESVLNHHKTVNEKND